MKFRVLMEPRAKSQFMQIVRWLCRRTTETRFKTKHGRTYRAVFTILNGQVRILAIRGPGQAPLKRRDLL